MTPASVAVTGALDLVDAFGHEADRVDHCREVAGKDVADRLSHVERLEHGERLGIPVDQVGEAVEHLHPLPRSESRPHAGAERLPGRGDRAIDVRLGPGGHLGQWLARGGIHGREATGASGIDETSVDEQPRFDPRPRGCGYRMPSGAIM